MSIYVLEPTIALPNHEVNKVDDLLKFLELKENRKLNILFRKSGIKKRHFFVNFDNEELNQTMMEVCLEASKKLFANYRIEPGDVDCIITCFNSAQIQLPGLSSRLFKTIGFKEEIPHYPLVGLGCGAFTGAVDLARKLLKSEDVHNVMIVCCEAHSPFFKENLDLDDNGKLTALTIFGDGASAAIISKDVMEAKTAAEIIDTKVATHYSESMTMVNNRAYLDKMLFKNIAPHVETLIKTLLKDNGMSINDVDHWVMHSGGKKILNGVKNLFGLSDIQMAPSIECYQEYGNLSCASVPIALNRLYSLNKQNKITIKPGDYGVILGFGSGFYLGANLVRFK